MVDKIHSTGALTVDPPIPIPPSVSRTSLPIWVRATPPISSTCAADGARAGSARPGALKTRAARPWGDRYRYGSAAVARQSGAPRRATAANGFQGQTRPAGSRNGRARATAATSSHSPRTDELRPKTARRCTRELF